MGARTRTGARAGPEARVLTQYFILLTSTKTPVCVLGSNTSRSVAISPSHFQYVETFLLRGPLGAKPRRLGCPVGISMAHSYGAPVEAWRATQRACGGRCVHRTAAHTVPLISSQKQPTRCVQPAGRRTDSAPPPTPYRDPGVVGGAGGRGRGRTRTREEPGGEREKEESHAGVVEA